MAIAWGTLKGFIREALLKDIPPVTAGDETILLFSNELMLTCARWASVSLSMHTAKESTLYLKGDGSQFSFPLPSGIVDSIEKTALIAYDTGSQDVEWLAPIRMSPRSFWPRQTLKSSDPNAAHGYWQWPRDILNFSFTPATDSVIEVRHFSIWTPPTNDDSIMEFDIPFEQPFAYMVASFCFDPLGAQASSIRQWNTKQDSGKPEDNPLQKQSRYFMDMAQARLDDIGAQDRETFYANDTQDYGPLGR